jgi:hypothetical protein
MKRTPKVYFAGKVSKNCYRTKLLKCSRVMSEADALYDTPNGKIQYNGPYSLSCDHGCFHSYAHGIAVNSDPSMCTGWLTSPSGDAVIQATHLSPKQAIKLCINKIQSSDLMIAYIETLDCFGTIAEIGMASALNKPVILFIYKTFWREDIDSSHFQDDTMIRNNECYDDLWFMKNLPRVAPLPGFPDLAAIPKQFFPKSQSHKEKYHEYLLSEKWSNLRKKKIKEAGGRCQLCNKSGLLNIHHRTYDNVFNERLEDLIALCKKCHEKFHDKV